MQYCRSVNLRDARLDDAKREAKIFADLKDDPGALSLANQFLHKHPEADFYVAYGPLAFHDKNNPTFDRDLDQIRKSVKALENPIAALKAEKAEDRFLAAAVLVAHYRTQKTPKAATEPIAAWKARAGSEAVEIVEWAIRQ